MKKDQLFLRIMIFFEQEDIQIIQEIHKNLEKFKRMVYLLLKEWKKKTMLKILW